MTKAAQIHLAKGLANAAGPSIRVNSVSPGLMMTVRTPRATIACYTRLTDVYRIGVKRFLRRYRRG